MDFTFFNSDKPAVKSNNGAVLIKIDVDFVNKD